MSEDNSKKPIDADDEVEKRRRQRRIDGLKGFAYFDTFEELEQWLPDDVDPIGRANTPLISRPTDTPEADNSKHLANVILIHDYAGNYHNYESVQDIGVDSESYSCEYMQFVDTFVYFSHKLVCVPPPAWTNSLHRNGVKVLGTFLIEPQTPHIERMLRKEIFREPRNQYWSYPIAQKLAQMASSYGFDGWLINIEKTFPWREWNPQSMRGFLEQLKFELGKEGLMVWYDSLTFYNQVHYQNCLDEANVHFATAASSILTNYKWNPTLLNYSARLAKNHNMSLSRVVAGIDVWAQNINSGGRRRVTWPRHDGGGTNTGQGVAQISTTGLSAGIFAPAWPFEHCPEFAQEVLRSMWDGITLPPDLRCGCGPAKPHHRSFSPEYAITKHAKEFRAGSDSFFYTNFERAFSTHDHVFNEYYDDRGLHAQLGAQSILPHFSQPSSVGGHSVYGEVRCNPSRLTILAGDASDENTKSCSSRADSNMTQLCLFKLGVLDRPNLRVSVRFCKEQTADDMQMELTFRWNDDLVQQMAIPREACANYTTCLPARQHINKGFSPAKLVEVQLCVTGHAPFADKNAALVEFYEILIKDGTPPEEECAIENLRVERRGAGELQHHRLIWECPACQDDRREFSDIVLEPCCRALPFSKTTGPFSHFLIEVDGTAIGRAHAMEYVLQDCIAARLVNEETLMFKVTGVGFDGRTISSHARQVEGFGATDYGWQLVQGLGTSDSTLTLQSDAGRRLGKLDVTEE
ncbi:hypothetical protein LTR50_004360 [Elasticomyces elasticus]|nr:hypothetical protein LTR50_004360 [Elasticomyces elasticus]